MTDNPEEPVTVTDKRRIDPETGQVREGNPGPAPSGPEHGAPEPGAADWQEPDAGAATDERIGELTADLQRLQADFANYRKRALRDAQVSAERGKAGVVGELLGVLDDLDRARSHGDLESGPLKAVADKLVGALTGLGLTAFGAEGDDFDPMLHEAVQHEGEGTHPVLGTVMRQGYKLGEHVLRHAMVGVVDTVVEPGAEDAGDGDAAAGQPETESAAPDDSE